MRFVEGHPDFGVDRRPGLVAGADLGEIRGVGRSLPARVVEHAVEPDLAGRGARLERGLDVGLKIRGCRPDQGAKH